MPDVPEDGAAAGGLPAAATSLADLQAEHGGVVLTWLRRINHVLHALAGITLILLLAWTVTDIIGLAAFNNPLRGTVELTELAVVVLVYLGLAHTESDDGHITVDLLFVRMKERGQLILRAIAGVIGVVVIAAMTWRLYVFAGQLDAGNYTTGVLRIPLYPVAILGVVGAAAFGLTVLANLAVVVRAIMKVR